MRYAFVSHTLPKLELADLLSLAREHGYDAVELRIQGNHAHGVELDLPPEERRRVRERVQAGGVGICCLATTCGMLDVEHAREQYETMVRAIDLAGDVGASAIRVWPGYVPDDMSRNGAARLIASPLRAVADRARDRGVTVCLETDATWSAPERMRQIMEQVDHPAIGVNWDTSHTAHDGACEVEEFFGAVGPWVRHVHLNNSVAVPGKKWRKALPMGAEGIDIRGLIRLLKSASFDGHISLEWIDGPAEVALPRDLATLKEFEQSDNAS
jgi:sugar phosphate isomerase/epimerase